MISPTQRTLPDNTQNSQETDVRAPGGIRTRNPSKGATAGPRLRPWGHWDRPALITPQEIVIIVEIIREYL